MRVPVHKKGLGLQKISEVRICRDDPWAERHLRGFRHAYANAPYLRDHLEPLAGIYTKGHERLFDLNLEILRYLVVCLKIDTRIVRMSELGVSGKGGELILALCGALGATRFLVQASALKYYDPDAFAAAGIEIVPHQKPGIVYPQLWGDFIANLSILDLLFDCGPKTRDIVFRQ